MIEDPLSVASYSPTVAEMSFLTLALPFVNKIGTPMFRRRVLELIPYKPLQKVKDIVDTMADKATAIFHSKLVAMNAGDEVVLKQIGEGKDIMSILSKL